MADCIPSLNETEGNSVCADAEGAPFFCNGLGEADDSCFGGCIVGLADVAVEARCRGDVDDRPIFGPVRLGVEVIRTLPWEPLKMDNGP
jgi:hypothetical protein